MNRIMCRWRYAAALLFTLVFGIWPVAKADVNVTKVGDPTFVPTDFHLFAAPIGTEATGYAEFLGTLQSILSPPQHADVPGLGIGPGIPHAGPYDQEMGKGVIGAGFVEATTFTTAQFSNGTAVFLGFMLVPGPNAPSGSSPDFASGPIMANAMFPLNFVSDTFTDGTFNDTGKSEVPAISTVPGFESLAGHSHIPLFTADNFDFASNDVPGAYEYRITLRDAAGNGYDVVAPFQVQAIPEPATWMTLCLGVLLLGAREVRHRQRGPQ